MFTLLSIIVVCATVTFISLRSEAKITFVVRHQHETIVNEDMIRLQEAFNKAPDNDRSPEEEIPTMDNIVSVLNNLATGGDPLE